MVSYDVIIIGSGPNGMLAGAYLSKAGMKVLVLDRRLECGGGLATEEVTLPGFLHNTHAIYHMMVEYAPVYKDLKLEEFPSKYEIFDIGPKTRKRYVGMIKKAKAIFWKGTAGYCEERQFSKGTEILLRAIEKSKAFSVIGGGHTITALERLKANKKKIGHISLSGGALLNYVAGKKLPAVEALISSRKK